MVNEAQYLELMSKYLSGNIDPAEREQLLSWAEESTEHKDFFDEMIQLWSISGSYEEPDFEVDPEAAWLHLEPRLEEEEDPEAESSSDTTSGGGGDPRIVPMHRPRKVWRIAAAIAVIVTLGTIGFWQVFQLNNAMEIVTAAGEKQEILLPDGSKVLLNQQSKLSYRTRFRQRNVQLEGEAFFDVASIPAKPFTISSGDVQTTVLGTAFNVRAYPEEAEVEVVVEEGLVKVEAITKTVNTEPVQLSPGQAVKYDKQVQSLEAAEVAIEEATIWRQAFLEFEEVPFTEITRKLERYFNIEIELDEERYSKCPFTIGKMVRPDLNTVFNLLEGLDFQIEELGAGKYRISGGMC